MKTCRWIQLLLVISVLMFSQTVWAEQWKISFNGYPGVMELSGSGNSYTGRFNLHGNWEQMLDLQVYRNAIFFRRAAADQKYLGVIEGTVMQGVFTQHGSGRYPWTAEKTASALPTADNSYQPQDTGVQPRNLALKRPARQSSTGYGGTADKAVDGNREGNYNAGSVSHTNNQPNEWWEVDLGNAKQVQAIKLWNRTDCCGERLSNFYVLVSATPFPSGNLQSTLNDPRVWSHHVEGAAGREVNIPVSAAGRYVRIQLASQNWLSLAEVEVLGSDLSTPVQRPTRRQKQQDFFDIE